MLLRATVGGMGAAIGRESIVEPELQQGTLVPVFDKGTAPSTNCCLVSNAFSRTRSEVRAFRDWILGEAAAQRTVASGAGWS